MSFTVRPCRTLEELAGCVRLQKEIWGYADAEVYPQRLFVNLPKIGGHVLGAFASGGRLVGFVAALPAWRGRRRYFHSLSLGVLPKYENRGIGRALKMAQRRAALRAGVDLIEWTFDPLRAKNAFFNIERLGAVARRYFPDHYGPIESRLQSGLPSDRLVAEWWLNSRRVQRALSGHSPRPRREPATVEVSIPIQVEPLLRSRPYQLHAWQVAVREQLQKYFSRKFVITGFLGDKRGARYVLDPVAAAGKPGEN